MLIELKSNDTVTVAILSDSHVPDRVNELHPALIVGLRELQPDYIFHAGDVSDQSVLIRLMEIAPVYAVRGNRDFLLANQLPMHQVFIINGVKVLLTHGHKDFLTYWWDKAVNFIQHYKIHRYFSRLQQIFPAARVFIFGHTHHAENTWQETRLYFNPGSCSAGEPPDFSISYGVVKFHLDGRIESQLIPLTGARVGFRKWKLQA
ncbi:MAG TPA: metallophosphoesterase family protein [Anaerolineaceae bacterium]|nr:metallophosphoesterase family protein [Anaerolineaceae bacterium]